MRRSYSRFSLCVMALAALAVLPIAAHAADGEAPKTDDTKVIVDQMLLENHREIDTTEELFKAAIKALKEDQTIGKAIAASVAAQKKSENQVMPGFYEIDEIIASQFGSQSLTQQISGTLNLINDQVMSGHEEVEGSAEFSMGQNNVAYNAFSRGTLAGLADAYTTHVQLFCIPGTANAPEGCGDSREAAGVLGSENFVDFLLGERTWGDAYVIDTMKLARVYFGSIPDVMHRDTLRKNKEGFVQNLKNMAHASLRMAVLNDLAARRAPSNEAVDSVLSVMLRNLEPSGATAGSTYDEVCSQKPNEMKAVERVVCGYTSKPPDFRSATALDPAVPREISQTVLEKVTQYDLYLSPYFYDMVNSTSFNSVGAMDKLEVYIKAQQLTQDYRQVQLLKMKTALAAASAAASTAKR
jgi:hypothetical protein